MKVLLVDDESDTLEQAKIFLEREDERIDVDTATSAEEGLQKFAVNDYDAIVSDYQMPGMNGLDFLENVRNERGSKIPFIIFTGKGREEVAMEALNLGADRYFQKGGDAKSQYRVLAQAIGQEVEHWYAEESLKSREKKYRDLTEKSLVGVYIIQDDEFKYVNPEFCKIFGYDEETLLGKNYKDLVAPRDKNLVAEGVNERQAGMGEPTRYPLKALNKEGEEIYVEVFSVPTTYQGEPAVQGTLIDITERKDMEEKFRKSEERFRSFINSTSDLVFLKDDEFRHILVNESYKEFLGKDEEEVIGKTDYDLLPEDLADQCRESDEKALQTGKTITVEEVFGNRVFESNKFPVELSGGEIGVGGIVKDITQRKGVEKKLRELHKTASKLEGAESEDEICQIAVDAAEEILEFSVCSIDLLDESGKLVVKAVSTEVEPEDYMERRPENAGLAGKTVLNKESYLLDDLHGAEDAKPVKEEYRSAISVPIKDKGVFQTISSETGHFDERDLEMVELLMDHVSEALERVRTEEREEFLHSLLRHDVRNKAQIVEGYIELLKDTDLTEEQEELVDKARDSSAKEMEIIEKVRALREVEKEEGGKIDISPIVRDAVEETEDEASKAGMDIELDCPEFKCKVRGKSLLKELFTNLIGNSIKHSGGSKIRIICRELEDEIVFSIEDDGEGIPEDIEDRIFERGFKSGENAGSGLGLYLVNEIAESYGGRIEVEDSKLGGARFDVHLQKA